MKLLISLSVLLSLVSSNLAVLSSAGNTTDEEKQNYIVKVTDPQAHRSLSTSSSHEILHVFKPQTHAPQEIICHTAMTEHNLNELLWLEWYIGSLRFIN